MSPDTKLLMCLTLAIVGMAVCGISLMLLDPKQREAFFGRWNPYKKCEADFEEQPGISTMSIPADKLACTSIKESKIIGGYIRQNPSGVQKLDWWAKFWGRCKLYTPYLDFHLELWPVISVATELWNHRYETMQMTWVSLSVRLFADRWTFRFRLYAPKSTVYRIG